MVMNKAQALSAFATAFDEWQEQCHPQRGRINALDMWMTGRQARPTLPATATQEMRILAEESRTPWGHLVVTASEQLLKVDGYRRPDSEDMSPGWLCWQANRMDSMQRPLYRGAIGHGVAYTVILPGSENPLTKLTTPSLRGVSAKRMVGLYDDFGDWPILALEGCPCDDDDGNRDWLFTLYDNEALYYFGIKGLDFKTAEFISASPHGAPVAPVVRYASRLTLEGHSHGDIRPIEPILRRLDRTVFDRMLAQRFASWKVRYATGMAKPETQEEEALQQAILAMGDILVNESTDARFGTLDSTDLTQFVASEDADLRSLASISQIPPAQLRGEISNLSAEALNAAEENLTRHAGEFKDSFGESHEQTLGLAEWYMVGEFDATAQVRWQDMSAQTMSAQADALGKLAAQLEVPVEMLWEMIPGWTQTDSTRAKALKANDPISVLNNMLNTQVGGGGA